MTKKNYFETFKKCTGSLCFPLLVDPSFQVVERLFVLPFEDNEIKTGHARYFLPSAEIKDYNVMIDGKIFLIN